MKKERIEKQIHAIVTHYFRQHLPSSEGVMITVTAVNITPGLDISKIFLSFVGTEAEIDQENLLKKLVVPHSWPIRKEIACKLGNIIRSVPKEIRFYVDPTPGKAASIEQLLGKIRDGE